MESCGAGVRALATIAAGSAPRPVDAAGGASADSAPRIVAVRQGPLLATSFHPELTGDARVHRLFATIVRESIG